MFSKAEADNRLMERKTERKWRTLRPLASQAAMPKEEEVSIPESEEIPEAPVPEVPVPEEPLAETPAPVEPDHGDVDDVPREKTAPIRVSLVPPVEIVEPDTEIDEAREWVAPESPPSQEAVRGREESAEVAIPDESESDLDFAVFEELERPDQFFATAISMGPEPTRDVISKPIHEPIHEPTREPISEVDQEPLDAGNRILIAHGVKSTSRLIRETLENFTEAEVESTSDPVRAFELALQKPFRRFFFAMQVGELSGSMLYELISKAYANGSATRRLAPGVVFIREKSDPQLPPELARDARVKDTISKPIRIERLLKSVEDIFEVRDPTVK